MGRQHTVILRPSGRRGHVDKGVSLREAERMAQKVQRYELPTDPAFQSQFMLAKSLPHMSDPFPHIEHLIPAREVDPIAQKLMRKKL